MRGFSTGDVGWPRSRGPMMEMDINIDKGLYEISLVNGSDKFVARSSYNAEQRQRATEFLTLTITDFISISSICFIL